MAKDQIPESGIGATEPTNYDFLSIIPQKELLALYESNTSIEKACRWLVAMALSAGIEFKKDSSFSAQKFGKDYEFPTFWDWFNWCGAYEEAIVAMSWAALFGKSIIVGYLDSNDGENSEKLSEKDLKPHGSAPFYDEIDIGVDKITKWSAQYIDDESNGYKIVKLNDKTNDPEIYAIFSTDDSEDILDRSKITKKTVHYVHASRVITLWAPKKTLSKKGNSKITNIAHLSKLENDMLNSCFVTMKNLMAGVMMYKAKENQKTDEINTLLKSFSHMSTMGWTGSDNLDDVIKLWIPDFKPDALERIDKLIVKKIAAGSNISIRTLGEEDVAAGLGDGGAGISHLLTKFEIMEIQRFYSRTLEQMIYMMGKPDSEFTWNEPMLKDEETLNLMIKQEQQTGPNKEEIKEDEKKNDKDK